MLTFSTANLLIHSLSRLLLIFAACAQGGNTNQAYVWVSQNGGLQTNATYHYTSYGDVTGELIGYNIVWLVYRVVEGFSTDLINISVSFWVDSVTKTLSANFD